MMSRLFKLFLLFFIPCLVTSVLGDDAIPIQNAGFENNRNNSPRRWQIQTSENAQIQIVPGKSGQALQISHHQWDQSTVHSASVDLTVGKLYRLSAWLKCSQAESHPTGRYPTPVAACLTMTSFPFTNHSPAVGSSTGWIKVETLFFATRAQDEVRLHFGYNGPAMGTVSFDEVSLEEVDDISEMIPLETVRRADRGFRYDDRGWIFLHIEGSPYQRGYQHGYLLAGEIASYLRKLGVQANENDPESGWSKTRFMADAMMLRKYETEFLEEMRGMADGMNRAGATLYDQSIDLVDMVTLNSVIDLGQARSGIGRSPHALSGKSFLSNEEELDIPEDQHKCSGFLANGPATPDGGIVFGQIFMWGGYTGPHWNVICDLDPEEGHRLVYQTYPGGIHSGADFYINETGLMMGETTVSQTPFNLDGSPQSNRIRKAAQYASSIDEAVAILKTGNNGMYTNDWLMGDVKTGETAIFLLGTYTNKLWRSGSGRFPGGTDGFFWSNNNNKDPEVRKEYIANGDNAPYDLVFTPWNRDIAFNRFYQKHKGHIDAIAGVNLWASSPINRPHACDGKITTSEMAREMMFLAHSGKVTLREKFIGENHRIPDLPEAEPRLSLGYSTANPRFVAKKLKAVFQDMPEKCDAIEKQIDTSEIQDALSYDKKDLWFNTVYPSQERDNWFVSATAAYWRLLNRLPDDLSQAQAYMEKELSLINSQLLFVESREGGLIPLNAQRKYDQYKHYKIPRIRGTYALHQLRLRLGNEAFSRLMTDLHTRYKEKPITTEKILAAAKKVSDKSIRPFIAQWLTRSDLPQLAIEASSVQQSDGWQVQLYIRQMGKPYDLETSVLIETEESIRYFPLAISGEECSRDIRLNEKPIRVEVNPMGDFPVEKERFYTFTNFYDDFHHVKIVYGTSRQIEANHTLARRYAKALADRYAETLPPVVKDSELDSMTAAASDLIILGGTEDNILMKRLAKTLNLSFGKNHFTWQGRCYARSDDGLFLALPNPFNQEENNGRIVYLFVANSAMQLYEMTKSVPRGLYSWGLYSGDKIEKTGFFKSEALSFDL